MLKTQKISTRSFTGKINSSKNKSTINYQSSLEAEYIYYLEYQKEVHSYVEQPLTIEYRDTHTNKIRTYTPDFLVCSVDPTTGSSKETLVEIKFRKDLRNNFSEYKPKFRAAISYCRINKMSFRIVTDQDLDEVYLKNIKFLFRFREISPSPDLVERLIQGLDGLGISNPKNLIEHVSRTKEGQAELIPQLWYLVNQNTVKCDLHLPLNMNSTITL